MAIDNYSPCPGGTGKKIKFCCPELLGDLQQIDRMVSGEQYLACLRHIEALEEQHPDKPCLLAIKARLLRVVGQPDKARAVAERFVEKHPRNQIALAELAMAAAILDGGFAGMTHLQHALAVVEKEMLGRVIEAMEIVAQMLMSEGHFRAARALLQLLAITAEEDDDRAAKMLFEMNGLPEVQLLIKDSAMLLECPEEVPWKARFDEAMEPHKRANWLISAERLAALAEEVVDQPVIWWNLAVLRGWLADTAGWVEALHKYATLDVPLEDAVEAEALALLLSGDPLGDNLDVLRLTCEVTDIEQLQSLLSASPRTIETPTEGLDIEDDDTPPRAAYWLLSNPMPEKPDQLNLETVPSILGRAMLFGRRTDREARLEVFGITSRNLDETEALLGEVAGGLLAEDFQQEMVTQVSASQAMLQHPWRLPPGTTPAQVDQLMEEHMRHVVLGEWPHLPLGLFEEKTIEQAAEDDANRVKVLAAILVLESWHRQADDDFDFNQLRAQLGLPELGPIDPDQLPPYKLPLVRLSRLIVDKLSDEALLNAYRQAAMFGAWRAARRLGGALVDRPGFDGKDEQLHTLNVLARIEDDSDRALEYAERGRRVVTARGESCARWDITELTIRLERGDSDEALSLIRHLHDKHLQEPGVAQVLSGILARAGVIGPGGGQPGEPPEEDPSLVVPGAAEAEPGKALDTRQSETGRREAGNLDTRHGLTSSKQPAGFGSREE